MTPAPRTITTPIARSFERASPPQDDTWRARNLVSCAACSRRKDAAKICGRSIRSSATSSGSSGMRTDTATSSDPPAPRKAPRILALGAHPDDIEFGCGGVLLAEAARGSEIFLCVCSRGEAASNGTPAERETEARAAAEMLGASLEFLEMGGDCHLERAAANALLIARRIRAARPDILLAPTGSPNQHPDHVDRQPTLRGRGPARALRRAGRTARSRRRIASRICSDTPSRRRPSRRGAVRLCGLISARSSSAGCA